jgi:hypothetical protein
MPRLYLVGGKQKDRVFRREAEWNLYECALILEVDTDSGVARTCVEYTTPAEAQATDNSSSQFKSASLVGNDLYACTGTEVLVYRTPDFKLLSYVSLPCFNDLHHVIPVGDNESLLAVSTGLDMVVQFTMQGEIIEVWDVLQDQPWKRFSRDIDYRKVRSTQPHRSHPNFIFSLDGEFWVTRFEQRDAICLGSPDRRISIGVGSPHDGVVCGDVVYFTVVDGRLVRVNASTLETEAVIDLKKIDEPECVLGWCRGVLPSGPDEYWVGFTRVRKTRWDRNLLWLRGKEGLIAKATHISLYDMSKMRCIQNINLEQLGMDVIFSILRIPGGCD